MNNYDEQSVVAYGQQNCYDDRESIYDDDKFADSIDKGKNNCEVRLNALQMFCFFFL